jgi:RNA polymerase sigma-70 factor (ECF subfamily)
MPAPLDPVDWIRAAQGGDRRAAGELWSLQRRFVATILLAHGSARDLDDLLQEVALRMTRSIGELEDPAHLRPWLRAIARNVAIDHGRRAPPPALQIAGDQDGSGHPPCAEPWLDTPSHERHRDDLEQVLRDLDGLHPTYREPLLLRAVDGLSQREIAALLDITETTVETRLARARRWLRERRDAQDPAADGPTGARPDARLRRTVD